VGEGGTQKTRRHRVNQKTDTTSERRAKIGVSHKLQRKGGRYERNGHMADAKEKIKVGNQWKKIELQGHLRKNLSFPPGRAKSRGKRENGRFTHSSPTQERRKKSGKTTARSETRRERRWSTQGSQQHTEVEEKGRRKRTVKKL